MKKFVLLLSFIILALGSEVRASHLFGSTITYECVNATTYRLYWTGYRDCSGSILAGPGPSFTLNGVGPGCTAPTGIGNWSATVVNEITPITPGIQTTCQGGFTLNGVEEVLAWRDYDFSSTNCTEYLVEYQICCRNAAITSFNASSNHYNSAGPIRPAQACNNSPVWRDIPVCLVWTGGTQTFDQGATDADGDSLVYSLVACQTGPSTPVIYFPGYSATQPLGPNWNVSLDPDYGLMTVTPTPGSMITSAFTVLCEEYRNGVKIGEIRRDQQVWTINGTPFVNGVPPTHNGFSNPVAGILANDSTIMVPPNTTFCVDFDADDADANSVTELSVLSLIPGLIISDTNGTPVNSVSEANPFLRICWISPASGTYTFYANAVDTACTINVTTLQEYTIVVGDTGTVWPGDANDDLIANNVDLLALGLAFSSTGPARNVQGNNWMAHLAIPWVDTIAGGIDHKHQDCNGDGVVNQDDTLAITLNYGLTHTKANTPATGSATDPPLTLVIPNDSAQIGDTIHAPILLGDSAISASNVLGLAFTLNYDATLIDSSKFWIEFSPSWLGNSNNTLDLSRNDHIAAACDGAVVRTDHMGQSGMGQIATAHFIIIDNIDGKKDQLVTETLNLFFSDIVIIDDLGARLSVNPVNDSIVVYELSTTNVPIDRPHSELTLYPNPATDYITLEKPGFPLQDVQIWNVQGQLVHQMQPNTDKIRFRTQELAPGVYFLKVRTEHGQEVKRLIVE